jgi:hypothetical protein
MKSAAGVRAPETTSVASAMLLVFCGLLASAAWNFLGPTLIGVFAALVQTGFVTRLVLLGLFFASAFALFALKTLNQVWYGYLACVVALAAAWTLLASLAVQMQTVEVLELAAAGYMLVRGLVNIREGARSVGSESQDR